MFPDDMTRCPNLIWVPPSAADFEPYLSLIQSISKAFYGKENQIESGARIQDIIEKLHIRIILYVVLKAQKSSSITFQESHGHPDHPTFAFLRAPNKKYWSWAVPNKNGDTSNCDVLNYKNCHNCCRWMRFDRKTKKKVDFKTHIDRCIKCSCGASYLDGIDDHGDKCKKQHCVKKGSKRDVNECITYKQTEAKHISFTDCYFADFETLVPKPEESGYYSVYAAGVLGPEKLRSNDTTIFYGEDTMSQFMEYMMNIKKDSILWFFNGSRFDNLFIVRWLMENGHLNHNPLLTAGSIMKFTFFTKNGKKIEVKDFARFVQGSLEANCKAFKINSDEAKSDFDHSKMKSWEDVEKYKHEWFDYLRRDVVALRACFMHLAKACLVEDKMDMRKFLTISHLAYGIFTSNLKPGLLFKTPYQDEAIMRETYRGGRIICGRKLWLSSSFEKCIEHEIVPNLIFEEMADFLVYLDVNSLYPSVQVERKYPCGKYKRLKKEKFFQQALQKNDLKFYDIWHKRIAKVDVKSPTNLMVPFLMSRTKEGKATQDLKTKIEVWYTGPELWEACILGYEILQIHEVVEWDKYQDIFTPYVLKCYESKKNAERDGPIYMLSKLKMNALTGKFGQKNKKNKKKLMLPIEMNGKQEVAFKNALKVIDKYGEDIGYMVTMVDEEELDSSYPIHLSAFILAHSKVFMSKLVREMKIEHEEKNAIVYSDTDSYILHQGNYVNLDKKYKGNELSQLKREVDGKIIATVVVAPKTYMLLYVHEKTKELKVKMRCKGIPHYSGDYGYHESFPVKGEDLVKFKSDLMKVWTRKKGEFCQNVIFKDNRYIVIPSSIYPIKAEFRDEEWFSKCEFIRRIEFRHMLGMIRGELKIDCVYPQMKRKTGSFYIEEIGVAPDYAVRSVFNTLWWDQAECMRQYPKDVNYDLFPTAYPLGHEKLNPPTLL